MTSLIYSWPLRDKTHCSSHVALTSFTDTSKDQFLKLLLGLKDIVVTYDKRAKVVTSRPTSRICERDFGRDAQRVCL